MLKSLGQVKDVTVSYDPDHEARLGDDRGVPDVPARHQGPGLSEWAAGREGEYRTGHDILGEHRRLARLPGEALLVSPMNCKGWGVDAGPDLVPGGPSSVETESRLGPLCRWPLDRSL